MVFELTNGLARCDKARLRALSLCISNLLVGYYEGNLILIASPLFCRFVEDKKLVKGYREHKALDYLKNNFGYRPNVLWHIRVVLDSPDVSKHELDIDFFSKTESIQFSSFLCEHLIDVRFYMRLAQHYYPNSPMATIERCGGGGSTADVLKSIKKRKVVCLVILDSDCKFPGSDRPPKGSTAFRCLQCYNKRCSNIELLVLAVHEIENLIPVSFMKQNTDAEGLKFLKRLEKHNLLNQLVYYDVKLGISKEEAVKYPGLMKFAKDLYEAVYPKKQSFDTYLSHKKDKEYLHPVLSPTMLSDYINDKLKAYQSDMYDNYRKEVADLVHTFMCCRGFEPINDLTAENPNLQA